MGQSKTLAEMTPEERQKLLDDFCGFEPLKQAFHDAFGPIVAAFNNLPSELLEALVAEQASGKKPELPEPDQIIHRDGSTQGSES